MPVNKITLIKRITMETEAGMCGVVSTGNGLSCVTHTDTHSYSHTSTRMKSHTVYKEQSGFVLTLLNTPNSHMLYCANLAALRSAPNVPRSLNYTGSIQEDADTSFVSHGMFRSSGSDPVPLLIC